LEAIILAGGFGTRLQQVVSEVPKSMAPVNGLPFLEYLLNYLAGQGIRKAILSVGFRKELIQDHFRDRYKNIAISYAVEEEPLGTGGGILNAIVQAEGETVFALNGDSMFRIDLNAMHQFHLETRADLTVALRFLEDTSRFGTVRLGSNKNITGFSEKDPEAGPGYINGGVYLINKDFFISHAPGARFSLEYDGLAGWCREFKLSGYPAKGYFIDIGVPDDYMTAQDEFKRFED
jgi:D-glycero-alpha-D-manno-heptose 1-phosphate guanylyltransferase